MNASLTLVVLQLPKGTHEWSKFITPGELSNIMDRSSIEVTSCCQALHVLQFFL